MCENKHVNNDTSRPAQLFNTFLKILRSTNSVVILKTSLGCQLSSSGGDFLTRKRLSKNGSLWVTWIPPKMPPTTEFLLLQSLRQKLACPQCANLQLCHDLHQQRPLMPHTNSTCTKSLLATSKSLRWCLCMSADCV